MPKITLLDGAMGTMLMERTGERKNVWQFNLSAPEHVKAIHDEYINAGSKIIFTNTFTANPIETGRENADLAKVLQKGIQIAKSAANGRAKVAFDIGPLPLMIEPFGDMTEEEAGSIFDEILSLGMKESPDYIWFETFIDLTMLKIAVKKACKYSVPIFASMAFEAVGKTIMGNSVEEMVNALSEYELSGIGLNCNITPDDATPLMKRFKDETDLPLIYKPNAGKPVVNESGKLMHELNANAFAQSSISALPYVSFIGACCGSNPLFIKALNDII